MTSALEQAKSLGIQIKGEPLETTKTSQDNNSAISAAESLGIKKRNIQQTTQNITEDKSPSFFEKSRTDVQRRMENILDTEKLKSQGKINLGSEVLQIVGQVGALTGDIGVNAISSALKTISPQPVETLVKNFGSYIADTDVAQQGMSALSIGVGNYREWKKDNLELARNLEALGNIAQFIPVGGGTTLGVKGVGKTSGVAGKVLVESAEKGIAKETQSFVRGLVRQVQTKAVREAQVARTTEKGFGIFKKTIVNPSYKELNAEKALLELADVSPKKTFQQNYNAVNEALKNTANDLEQTILARDFIIPKREVVANLNKAAEKLSLSPLIVGDAEKTAQKLINGARKFIEENKGSGSGLLQARKDFDAWVKKQKPKVFDAKSENAFTIANREIRDTLTDLLEKKAPEAGVRASLKKQTGLYTALDNIAPKAAMESNYAFGRLLQKVGDKIGTKNKITQTIVAGATVGVGGIGAAIAPAAAAFGVGGYLVFKGGKLVLNPRLRKVVGEALLELDKIINKASTPVKVQSEIELKNYFNKLLNDERGIIQVPSVMTKKVTKIPDEIINSFRADDISFIEKFIDDVRLGKELTVGDEITARSILRNAGIPEDISNTKIANMFSDALDRYSLVEKPLLQKVNSAKPLESSLLQEAKKFKTADEFVKAQPKVYHGTQAKFDKFETKFATDAEGRKLNLGWGKNNFYFTTKKGEALKYATRERSPEVAKLYPKGEPNVIEAFVDIKKPFDMEIGKNAERWRKVRDGYWSDGVSDFNYHKIPNGKTKAEAFVEQLKKEGYDGIIDGQEITAFSESSIKTKSQLIDIWNKANKK